jgi:hypothetical protein
MGMRPLIYYRGGSLLEDRVRRVQSASALLRLYCELDETRRLIGSAEASSGRWVSAPPLAGSTAKRSVLPCLLLLRGPRLSSDSDATTPTIPGRTAQDERFPPLRRSRSAGLGKTLRGRAAVVHTPQHRRGRKPMSDIQAIADRFEIEPQEILRVTCVAPRTNRRQKELRK